MGIDRNSAFGDYGPPPGGPRKREGSFLFTSGPKLIGIIPVFLFASAIVGATSLRGNVILLGALFTLSYIGYIKIIDGLRNAHLRNQVEQGLQKLYEKENGG